MLKLGIFETVNDEVGEIIVADVNAAVIRALVEPASKERERLISKA
jgi:hypothetical protein